MTTKAYGGNTSRIGADLSLPVTPTASFVATLHPDYSNVEVDQQTIAPTAFARQYAEVRPFFTQVGSSFNSHSSCSNCPQTLYTPSIPTFGQGYALEGTQGRLTFSGFDAIGDQRNDQAETLNYNYEDKGQSEGVSFQNVGVDLPGLRDTTTTLDAGYGNQHSHLLVYANTGIDRGSLVDDPGQANYFEDGIGYADSTSVLIGSYQRVGAQFEPFDGYVSQTDILGYEVFGEKTLNFSPKATIHDVSVSSFFARYANHLGATAQTDGNVQVNVDFRDLLTAHVYSSSQGVLTFSNQLLPFGSNGAFVGYRTNTTTPSYVNYDGGGYSHGHLNSWSYVTTVPLARRINLGFEADENQYLTRYPGEISSTQWLERASFDWQLSKDAQFDIGARRIVGANLPNAFQPLAYGTLGPCRANPYLPGCFVDAANVSLAFHFLAARNEFYVVYGDPNSLATTPALFLKWIRYIGAEKGS